MPRINAINRDFYVLTHLLLNGYRKPFLASYKITYRCNLSCEQCPFRLMQSADPTFAEVIQTLDRLHDRGDRLVVFEGGEPLLWRDGNRSMQDVVAEAKKRFFSVGITTNGTQPLDIDSDILWVSLDGLRDTHNCLRGAEIFDRVIEHIRESRHPKLFAHITANRKNAAEIPELVRFLKSLVKGITIQFYYPYGQNDELFLANDQRINLLEQLISLKKKGYPIMNSIAGLEALKRNTWRCLSDLIDSVNPDGTIQQGCYLQNRAEIDCSRCGFSPYTEMSLACRGNIGAINAGLDIFFRASKTRLTQSSRHSKPE